MHRPARFIALAAAGWLVLACPCSGQDALDWPIGVGDPLPGVPAGDYAQFTPPAPNLIRSHARPSLPDPEPAPSALAEPLLTSQARQTLSFYGGHSARATLQQLPRRSRVAWNTSSPVPSIQKPHEHATNGPTVSPYLNLYRGEDDSESIPNYFAFVRPQLQQMEANRRQHRDLQRLQRQVQTVSTTLAGQQYRAAVIPSTGTSARYMDTAQFYSRWQQ